MGHCFAGVGDSCAVVVVACVDLSTARRGPGQPRRAMEMPASHMNARTHARTRRRRRTRTHTSFTFVFDHYCWHHFLLASFPAGINYCWHQLLLASITAGINNCWHQRRIHVEWGRGPVPLGPCGKSFHCLEVDDGEDMADH